MFQIEKNIPVPAYYRGGGVFKYPWLTMEIGDSFCVPAEQAGWSLNKNGSRINVVGRTASGAGKKYGKKFTARTQADNSVRVWRVA